MPPAGLEPALCRQKGILSPSCLPAFGKVDFHSLYRLIFHCERDFSFVSERDSHFFDKTIFGNSLSTFRHKQDSTLVAEQTAISSIFAFFVSIYSVFVERPG